MRVLLIVECSQIDQIWFYLYIIIWKSQKKRYKTKEKSFQYTAVQYPEFS